MVILGEDIAALLGLVFALVAIAATMLTGNPVWDAIGSMSIGALLIVVAIGIGVEIKALLIGQSAEPETEARLRAFFEKQDGVDHVYRLITLQLGTSLMVSVKARLKGRSANELVASHQPRRSRGARRVSRNPVAVLRARHRGLTPQEVDHGMDQRSDRLGRALPRWSCSRSCSASTT